MTQKTKLLPSIILQSTLFAITMISLISIFNKSWAKFFIGPILLSILLFSCSNPKENKADSDTEGNKQDVIGQPQASIKDTDGNTYATVLIGEQVWMAENLRKTIFNCKNGEDVKFTNGLERGPGVAFYDGAPRYAYYNNDPSKGYGVLYSYGAMTNCRLCPSGYKVPSKGDWDQLMQTLGGRHNDGVQLLKGGSTGFNAGLGGRIDDDGSVLSSKYEFWWSTTKGASKNEDFNIFNFEIEGTGIAKIKGQDFRVGNYVRCIRE